MSTRSRFYPNLYKDSVSLMKVSAQVVAVAGIEAAVKRLGEAGVVTRALSSLALERPRDHGVLLGFAAWRENEISAALRTMTSILAC